MSNRFYNSTSAAAPQVLIRSAAENNQFAAVALGFTRVQAEVDTAVAEITAARGTSASLAENLTRYLVADEGLTVDLAANGKRITGLSAPVSDSEPATKAYADGLAFAAVNLPSQAGNAGKEITTNGTTAGWGLSVPGAISILTLFGYA